MSRCPPLSAVQKARARALRGKTIARVALNPFDPNEEDGNAYPTDQPNTAPVIWFTDGTCLRFVVEESEVSEYGVSLVYPGRTTT